MNTMSITELIAKKKAEYASTAPEKKEAPKVAHDLPSIEYPVFDRSDLGSDLSATEFTEGLLAVRKPDGKGNLVPVVTPQKSLRVPYGTGSFKYSSPSLTSPPDKDMYARLVTAELYNYSNPTTKMFRSNGTRKGLLTRMSQQLIAKNSKLTTSNLTLLHMVKMLPVATIKEEQFLKSCDLTNPCYEKLNLKASAGFPYAFEARGQGGIPDIGGDTYLKLDYHNLPPTKKGVLSLPVPLNKKPMAVAEHAITWTKKIFKVIDDAPSLKEALLSLSDFTDKYPDLKTFMLKRKDEKHERSEMLTKVRPYGVQPLPSRFYCMWAFHVLESNLLNFVDHPDSISAYHFSQFYGGGKRLLDHFVTGHKAGKLHTALSYGDDQLWMLKLSGSEVVYLTPDVKAMDMNTSSECIISHSKYLKGAIKNLPDVNFRAFVVAMTMAFNHHMHTDGSGVVGKTESLLSGIPGTTIINIINSAKIISVFITALETKLSTDRVKLDKTNFFKYYAYSLEQVTKLTGYTFKGMEGLSLKVANSTFEKLCDEFRGQVHFNDINNIYTSGIPLPFLSNTVKIIDGNPICVPYDLTKFGASLVLPAATSYKAGVKSQIERIVGVAFSGGWTDDKFFAFLQQTFASCRQRNNKHYGVDDLPAGAEEDVLEIVKYIKESTSINDLPSREFFYDMNVMTKEDFALKHLAGVQQVSELRSSKDEVSDEDTVSVSAGGLADILEAADDLQGFNLNDQSSPPISKSKMGNSNALNIQEEDTKRFNALVRWAKQRAMRLSVDFGLSSKTTKRMSKIIESHEDDFRIEMLEEVFQDIYDPEEEEYEAYQELLDRSHDLASAWDAWQPYDYEDEDPNLDDVADADPLDELQDFELGSDKLSDEL